MAFSTPSASSRSIFSIDETSTSGVKTYNFTIPQDAQAIVGKIYLDSTWSATGSAKVTVQTSEDGGTTWRDAVGMSVGGNIVTSTVNNDQAQFFAVPVAGNTPRGIANWVGSVQASTLAQTATSGSITGLTSGLPMMGTLARVQFAYTGSISTGGINVVIYAPATDFTA